MVPSIDAQRVASIMLSWHSLEVVSFKKVQSLWAGYGHICEVTARATGDQCAAQMRDECVNIDNKSKEILSSTSELILKFISPPPTKPATEDEGHLRKMMSYEVEQYFYESIAPQLRVGVPVAQCIATTRDMAGKPGNELLEGLTATIMTDLRPSYPVAGEKRSELNEKQVYSALNWLAGFHRATWGVSSSTPLDEFILPPLPEARRRRQEGVKPGSIAWLNGGYTYLATRRKEYALLAEDSDSEWSKALCTPSEPRGTSIAEQVAQFLTPRNRPYETLIHGDVKSENLFSTESGDAVAFYDFQYVGIGLGVCDLAKLFTCSVPMRMLFRGEYAAHVIPDVLEMEEGERELLKHYHEKLLSLEVDAAEGTVERSYEWSVFVMHWKTALVDWLRFQASWGFWGNTEWLEARVRSILKDQDWIDWLHSELTLGERQNSSLPD